MRKPCTGGQLSTQVASLQSAINTLGSEKSSFSNELNRLGDISKKLNHVISQGMRSERAITELACGVESLQEQVKNQPTLPTPGHTASSGTKEKPQSIENLVEVAKTLLQATPNTLLMGYSLHLAHTRAPSTTVTDILFKHYALPLSSQQAKEGRGKDLERFLWPAAEFLRIFKDFGLLQFETNEDVPVFSSEMIAAMDAVSDFFELPTLEQDAAAIKATYPT